MQRDSTVHTPHRDTQQSSYTHTAQCTHLKLTHTTHDTHTLKWRHLTQSQDWENTLHSKYTHRDTQHATHTYSAVQTHQRHNLPETHTPQCKQLTHTHTHTRAHTHTYTRTHTHTYTHAHAHTHTAFPIFKGDFDRSFLHFTGSYQNQGTSSRFLVDCP